MASSASATERLRAWTVVLASVAAVGLVLHLASARQSGPEADEDDDPLFQRFAS